MILNPTRCLAVVGTVLFCGVASAEPEAPRLLDPYDGNFDAELLGTAVDGPYAVGHDADECDTICPSGFTSKPDGLTISSPGTYDCINSTDTIKIASDNVTIRCSHIDGGVDPDVSTSSKYGICNIGTCNGAHDNLVVQYTEVEGCSKGVISEGEVTLDHVYIHDADDGIYNTGDIAANRTLIVIHNTHAGAHSDSIQNRGSGDVEFVESKLLDISPTDGALFEKNGLRRGYFKSNYIVGQWAILFDGTVKHNNVSFVNNRMAGYQLCFVAPAGACGSGWGSEGWSGNTYVTGAPHDINGNPADACGTGTIGNPCD